MNNRKTNNIPEYGILLYFFKIILNEMQVSRITISQCRKVLYPTSRISFRIPFLDRPRTFQHSLIVISDRQVLVSL